VTIPAGTKLGRYEIRSKLGAGGMGEVYLAQDTSELGRAVALKIVPAEVANNKDRLQRFTQEARTVSNLNHPNILTVYEFGQTDSGSFIATEYIDGVTLREHVSGRRLKLVDILDLAIQIVAALNAAHEAGVTHRDLKPENVMVRRDQIVKVLDFGLAKLAAPSSTSSIEEIDREAGTRVFVQTEPGMVMGTVAYMSPEQSAGHSIDQRTDIWSFGVLLYEMLAGCVPFQGKDVHRQIIAIQENAPAPLATLVEGVPDRLEEIVAKCLAKDKDERYQTAKDLLIDLRNLRRKLDVDAEIERTFAPALRNTGAGTSPASTKVPPLNGVATNPSASPASSAEYLVTGIKQHKFAVGVAVLVVLAALAMMGIYLRGRNTTAAIRSIAVLPFQNRSADKDTDYLSDGLADSLVFRLSQLPGLKVSPTSSVMQYKGKEADLSKIAGELGVDSVMTGRFTKRGDNLDITVELVDTRNNKSLWGEQYERKMSDLMATQREIANSITQKLQMQLAGNEPGIAKKYTSSNEAYQLYLKGRFHWAKRTKDEMQKSIEAYKQAIEIDPKFALAYVGIAYSYNSMGKNPDVAPKDAIPFAKAAAARALELDPSLAEAHAAMADSLAIGDWNWAESEREFKRSMELDPNISYTHLAYAGSFLTAAGRPDEVVSESERALELEPISLINNTVTASSLIYGRKFDQALTQAQKAFDLDQNFPLSRLWLSLALIAKGKYDDAIALGNDRPKQTASWWTILSVTALAHARAGHPAEARKLLGELREIEKAQYVRTYYVAMIYVALDDKDNAFAELEKSFRDKDCYLPRARVDPFMDPLREDARFKDLMKRMGLAE
jgi:eukaryotic-like serine/threonine-protein kinase